MTEPHIKYLGPISQAQPERRVVPWWKRVQWPFVAIVVAPTLIAMIYFLFVASPQYVSEARFLVRSANGSTPTPFGVALQGVGLSAAQTDAFSVHEYITSQEALKDLQRRFDVAALLGPADADVFSRYPLISETRSSEGLQKALKRFVLVGYDSTTGISTLRVRAFRPQDAKALNAALLDGGEALVNRLNERSARDAVTDARFAQEQAQARLDEVQQQLTTFRNQEQFIDPARTALEAGQLIGNLMTTLAELRAERSQIAAEAPQSPQLPALDRRIAAFEREMETERAKMAGDSSSLAPMVGVYEELLRRREFATKELAQTTTSLLTAEQEARRQKLYLERVVPSSTPEEPTEPKRWLAILAVFGTTILIYGIGSLVWAGVREHRQE